MAVRRNKNRAILAAVAAAVVVVAAVTTYIAFTPWSANHFGYAFAGRDGLPAYVYASDRRYMTYQTCAGEQTRVHAPLTLACASRGPRRRLRWAA